MKVAAYYKFENLSDRLRLQHKIKSKARLDCTAFVNLSKYTGLTDFVNHKGQMYLYKVQANEIVRVNSKRLAEWALSNGSINLTSIFFEDADYPEYGYGYPNSNRTLSNGYNNPLFLHRNDCYLFITNEDLPIIELFIIKNGRNSVQGFYQQLIDGCLDKETNLLRSMAEPYFNYEGAYSK
jgi:hypothetical protein